MKKYIVAFLICLILLSACVPEGRVTIQENSKGISYELFYIEGMPCMRFIHTEIAYQKYDGVSCDWSKWNGN